MTDNRSSCDNCTQNHNYCEVENKYKYGFCGNWCGESKDNELEDAPTVEYPEQITIKCDTEEDKQKLLSALRNARLTICEEAEND